MVPRVIARAVKWVDEYANSNHEVDAGAAMIAFGSLLEFLPPLSALLSIVWVALRIWETDTVRGMTGRRGATKEPIE